MKMEMRGKGLIPFLSLIALMLLLPVANDTSFSATDGPNYFLPPGITQPITQRITALGVKDQDGSFLLLYRQELSWDAKGFATEYTRFSQDQADYLNMFIRALTGEWEQRRAKAKNWRIRFTKNQDPQKRQRGYSATIECKVRGSGVILSWGGQHPTFAFNWLFEPLGFDLYALKYTSNSSLRREGRLNNAPTIILLSFPWPIEHCHYHVWYKKTSR